MNIEYWVNTEEYTIAFATSLRTAKRMLQQYQNREDYPTAVKWKEDEGTYYGYVDGDLVGSLIPITEKLVDRLHF